MRLYCVVMKVVNYVYNVFIVFVYVYVVCCIMYCLDKLYICYNNYFMMICK